MNSHFTLALCMLELSVVSSPAGRTSFGRLSAEEDEEDEGGAGRFELEEGFVGTGVVVFDFFFDLFFLPI